jgi:hypothetical protein
MVFDVHVRRKMGNCVNESLDNKIRLHGAEELSLGNALNLTPRHKVQWDHRGENVTAIDSCFLYESNDRLFISCMLLCSPNAPPAKTVSTFSFQRVTSERCRDSVSQLVLSKAAFRALSF